MVAWLKRRLTRRQFLGASAVSAIALAACSDDDSDPSPTTAATAPSTVASSTSPGQALAPTPACADDDDVTPEQTEGPFFTPDSPERQSLLEPGLSGETLVVSGLVLSTDCRPISGALLDFWQADDAGEYDNEGYRLRGHQFAGDDGSYRLETINPGLYTGRTRHIHVKVQAPDRPVLTTQLYFPAEPGNQQDGIFDDALVMTIDESGGARQGSFNFVLDLG